MSIKKYLPEHFKGSDLPNLKGLIEAFDAGDAHIADMLAEARKQLFLSTASSSYLINLASQFGFVLPKNSGLDEYGFRNLAIPAISSPKQSIPTFNKIVEAFYTAAVLHPSLSTEVTDTYSLLDGDDLVFETETDIVGVLFKADKFSNLADVTAAELASSINSQQNTLFADKFLDRTSGRYRLRVISKAYGSSAKIRLIGGTAQNILKFQSTKATSVMPGTTWNITKEANVTYSSVVKFTWDGTGTDPKTYLLDAGDTLTVRGLANVGGVQFSRLNGSYEILDVGHNYFTVINPAFRYTGVSLVHTSASQMAFTSSVPKTLFDNSEYAVVSESKIGEIDVSIPAIPPIVRRQLNGSTRLRGSIYSVLDMNPGRITVEYPNQLPDLGTFVYSSDRFAEGFTHRFYKYSSKAAPSGSAQDLILDVTGRQLPFLSAPEALTALSSSRISDPIFGEIDQSDIIVNTGSVAHYFENAHEITIGGVSTDSAILKHKTITGILLDSGGEKEFEHEMGSSFMYINFIDAITGEILRFDYRPSSLDPLNRTRLYYLPEFEGRYVKAVVCTINENLISGQVTAKIGPFTLNPAGGVQNFQHNFNTTNVAFKILDANGRVVVGVQRIVDANSVELVYDGAPSGFQVSALCIDFQHVFNNLVRSVAVNLTLPAAPAGVYEYSLQHNLLSTNLIVDVKDRTNTSLHSFPRVFLDDENHLKISYNGTSTTQNVDVLMLASYINPVESIDGGLLVSEINTQHIVKEVIDLSNYKFEVLGTGPLIDGIGTITTVGKTLTGTGTQFLIQVTVGDYVVAQEQRREVTQIISDTHLELKCAFTPSIASPLPFKLSNAQHNGTILGEPVKYGGAVVASFDVEGFIDTVRGTDVRFVFSDRIAAANANFTIGSRVRIMAAGTDLQTTAAEFLRSIYLSVHSRDGRYIYFKSGITALNGLIIQEAKCRRSGYFGGSEFTHHFDKTSEWNKNTWLRNGKVTLLSSNVASNDKYLGSYIYDTIGTTFPYVVGSAQAVIQAAVNAFSTPGTILVDNVDALPSTGYIFFDFGNNAIEGPVRYNLVIPGTPSQILIDPSYVFKKEHKLGSIVRLATSISPIELGATASEYPSYITGAIEARHTLENILMSLVSVGVLLKMSLQLPTLRFYEPSIAPFA